jgi:hypothetical protein
LQWIDDNNLLYYFHHQRSSLVYTGALWRKSLCNSLLLDEDFHWGPSLDDFALELAKHNGVIYNESDSDGSVEAASDMDILEDLGLLQLDSHLEDFENCIALQENANWSPRKRKHM